MTILEECVDTLVLGGGPCGLGAATRLQQHGEAVTGSWLLLADCKEAGGLAMTDTTPEGFLYDMGGHVIFSHWDYFDQLLDAAVGTDPPNTPNTETKYWNNHQRVSYVRIKNRWVEYPFQNNLYKLDPDDQITCINGVLDAAIQNQNMQINCFDDWILKVMGNGIADLFMRPYNFKVWAYPTTEMSSNWLGERVATVDAKKVVANVIKNKSDANWGPNAVFRFPKTGGTGGIWKKVGNLLDQSKLRFKHRIVDIDTEKRVVSYSILGKDGDTNENINTGYENDGSLPVHGQIRYNKMVSTLPLDEMARFAKLIYPEGPSLAKGETSKRLHFSATHVVGIGLRGVSPHELKCWLYFPESDCPFYRCTVFSHYSEYNSPPKDKLLPTIQLCNGEKIKGEPKPGPYWSLMFEISGSEKHKPVDVETLIADTIQGAINTTMVSPTDEIVSIYHRRLHKGYPTPHVDRDSCINKFLPELQSKGIWSRGRFGAWKYEMGNQDHTCMQGVEAVDSLLFGAKEFGIHYPDKTNQSKNKDMRYWRTPADKKC